MRKPTLFMICLPCLFLFSHCSKTNSQPDPAPIILNITPNLVSVGSQVTINGSNFSSVKSKDVVKFNNAIATVVSATTTQLVVTVPNGAEGSKTVTVSVSGQSVTSSPIAFRVLTTTESLLLGTWTFASSFRSYSLPGGSTNSFQLNNLSSVSNYLNFSDSGILYSKLDGWGAGLSGSIFVDTISYNVSNNQIFLSFPGGVNHYGGTVLNYAAYHDTINIKSLSSNSFSYSRNYHFKHIINANETKSSVDSLVK